MKCSALSETECRNGFPVTASCHGINTGAVPFCCQEDNLLVSELAARRRAQPTKEPTQ